MAYMVQTTKKVIDKSKWDRWLIERSLNIVNSNKI